MNQAVRVQLVQRFGETEGKMDAFDGGELAVFSKDVP